MQARTLVSARALMVLLLSLVMGLFGCDKVKQFVSKMSSAPPKAIKGPKVTIIITKPSKAVRIVGGHKALIRKALKKVTGYRDSSVDWDKKKIVVGYKGDADTDKFLESLREYGYGVKMEGGDDD